MSDTTSLDVVLIKKAECLDCAHLAPGIKKAKRECFGERNCPASTYNVAIGVDLLSTSERLAKAWHTGNVETIGSVMAELRKLHSAVQEKVVTLAKAKMREL